MQNEILNGLMQMEFLNELDRLAGYDKFDDYYKGKHPLMLPAKLKDILKDNYGILANYCASVIDAPTSKLKIKSVNCEDKKAEQFLKRVWSKNRMDAKPTKIHRQTFVKGDCFVSVFPHFTKGSIKPDRYNIKIIRPEHIFPFYSSDDEADLEYVVQQWVGWNNELNIPMAYKWIYYTDKIERYIATDSGLTIDMPQSSLLNLYKNWIPDTNNADGLGAVLNNPYGVIPIVPFRNKAYDSPFGTSEIEKAIPIQDAINKCLVDLMHIVDLQAFSQRIITGLDSEENIPINPETNKRDFKAGAGETWVIAGADAKVSELRPTDLNGILETIEKLIDRLCEVTRTPKMALNNSGGNVSSGFALAKTEAPLIEKCEESQISFGNSYEDINTLLLKMAKYHGDLSFDEIPETEINWKTLVETSPSDSFQEAQRLQMLKQNNVISSAEWARLEGYDPEQIKSMQEEINQENESNMGNVIGHSFSATATNTDTANINDVVNNE